MVGRRVQVRRASWAAGVCAALLALGVVAIALVSSTSSAWFWVVLGGAVVAAALAVIGWYVARAFSSGVPEVIVRPSYMYKLHESKRRKDLFPEYGCRQRVWAFNSKLDGYALARSVGVEIPLTHRRLTTIQELEWDELPERFVLKPHSGTASRGIMLLVRDGDGFRDLMVNEWKTRADIKAEIRRLLDAKLISPSLAVEEMLVPGPDLAGVEEIPDDLKIYCFYDRPVVIMQRRLGGEADHRKWRFKFWTHDWQDLGKVKYADRCDPSLQPPAGADAVVDAAALMAKKLAIPFVRLDLYDTDRGPVIGEVSPHPGPPELWRADVDEMLGRAWENAEFRLSIEGISPVEPIPSDRASANFRLPAPLPKGRRLHERASFAFKLHESARRRDALLTSGVDHADCAFRSVVSIAELAATLGTHSVVVHERVSSIRDLDWDSVPPRFSVESESGAINDRRLLLRRDGDGFRDLHNGQPMSRIKVVDAYQALVAAASEGVVVAELPVPRDRMCSDLELADLFSVLCFGGRPSAVVQRRRWWTKNGESARLWTPEWHELAMVQPTALETGAPERPECGAELVGVAARVAGEIATAFVCVDVYDSDRGLLLGQIRDHPGLEDAWGPAIDELLGAAWEDAEARLMASDVMQAQSVSEDSADSAG